MVISVVWRGANNLIINLLRYCSSEWTDRCKVDEVVVQVVPLHSSSTEEGVSKLFSSALVNYEASVIVPYVTVYGVARYKVRLYLSG